MQCVASVVIMEVLQTQDALLVCVLLASLELIVQWISTNVLLIHAVVMEIALMEEIASHVTVILPILE